MKIFIVEDDVSIRTELAILLEKYGYACESTDDFENIIEHIFAAKPDMILLDINLPYQDGYTVCREVRKKSNIPIIVLTSRNTDFDELLSLNIGADDFVSKPYNAQVLVARIQKLFKRVYELQESSVLTHKGLTLNLLKATMSCGNVEVELTKNELGILRLLILNKGNVIPRDAIIDELWQSDEFIDENTLNVNIVRIRKKLDQVGLIGYLETKRGLGYRV
ncbi:MAG: response regulator transcription factor [Lachnospiraceae bacterium]|nr:response regulator transcription factor [Lachnospiraceae bacterium]